MSEQRLIDAFEVQRLLNMSYNNLGLDGFSLGFRKALGLAIQTIENAPAIDPVRHGYVLSSVHEQVQWERDIAIDQLHSYGVEFGEKAEMQRVRHGKWEFIDEPMMQAYRCSECGGYHCRYSYCPNCGARMDKE